MLVRHGWFGQTLPTMESWKNEPTLPKPRFRVVRQAMNALPTAHCKYGLGSLQGTEVAGR